MRKEKTAVQVLSDEELAGEVERVRNTLGPQMEELVRKRLDELANFNDSSERQMGIVRREVPIMPEKVTLGKYRKRVDGKERWVVLGKSFSKGVGGKRHHKGGGEGSETEEEKKKQKMDEKSEASTEEGPGVRTIKYINSSEEEKDERRVSLVDTPERKSEVETEDSPGKQVGTAKQVELSLEERSEEDLGKLDREVVLVSSEGGGSDQELLTEYSPTKVVRRKVVEVEADTTNPDSTVQELQGGSGTVTARVVKESNIGIDDEVLQGEQTETETEVEEEEDFPLVEEAEYEEQPSDDEPPTDDEPQEEELELAKQIEHDLMLAQDKEERLIQKRKKTARGLAMALSKLPIKKVNTQMADEDGAQYSWEEQREREAQKEKERAEANREATRAKANTSQNMDGHKKAEGGSPGGADDL